VIGDIKHLKALSFPARAATPLHGHLLAPVVTCVHQAPKHTVPASLCNLVRVVRWKMCLISCCVRAQFGGLLMVLSIRLPYLMVRIKLRWLMLSCECCNEDGGVADMIAIGDW